jgi:hypothetical protein
LQQLKNNRHWSADATFDICPGVFSQLWVVGFYIGHKMFPAVHCLMTRKTREQYEEALHFLATKLADHERPLSGLLFYK